MIKLKDIPNSEKPRERLIKYGASNLSNEELLMIILGSGTKDMDVKQLADNILVRLDNIQKLKDLNIKKLMEIKGIGQVKALLLLACLELGKRVYQDTTIEDLIRCTNPSNIISYFNYLFKDKKQEYFYVLYLDNKKQFIDKKMLFKGSIATSLIHPREIFKEAYLLSSSYMICLHNHPSGDPLPSKEDILVTKRLVELGNLHAIPLIDHIIIGNNCYYSFYQDDKL